MREFKVGDFVKHRKNDQLVFRILEVSQPPGDALYRCLSTEDDTTLLMYAEEDLYRVDPSEAGVYMPIEQTQLDSVLLEGYRNATYEVQTIVPYKGNPMTNLYILNHRQLSDFLIRCGDHSEFVISVKRVELPVP